MKKLYMFLAVVLLMVTGCGPGGWGPLSSAKAITAFIFPTSTSTTIDEVAHTIVVTMPFGTDVTALVPTITHTGASISPSSGVAQNFTSPVTYTVTAADGSTQDYTVTVTGAHLVMIPVPPGSFQRDGTPANISNITTAFRISQCEITRAQFLAIMGTDPSDTYYSTGLNDPVQQVNWYHAIAFCNKLSIAEGFTPVYSVTGVDFTTLTYGNIPTSDNAAWNAAVATWANNGYRLPTEMEWEWAAMGATSGSGYTSPTYLTGYGKLFAGSDSILANGSGGTNVIGDYAWTWENSSDYSKSQPVGTKLPNELGLYDMSGNVWEWCWDKWDGSAAYPDGMLDNDTYRNTTSGANRVMRGGSWSDIAFYDPVAYRYLQAQDRQYSRFGFRVVRP